MILYQYRSGDGPSSISPPCAKIEMALKLIGADYRVENVASPFEVSKISRTGRLPVLEVDGERIHDSIMILDALERRFPDAPLWPSDPDQRRQDRLWDHFGTDSLYWYGFFCRWIHPEWAPRTHEALFAGRPWHMRMMVRAFFLPRVRRRAMLHGVGGKAPESVVAELERAIVMIEESLGDGPFLQGRDHPGRGDLACSALIAQAGFRDTLPELLQLVRAHPKVVAMVRDVFVACGWEAPNGFAA